MTFIISFVQCITGEEPCIKEHFLGFIPVEHSAGGALTETLLEQLEKMKIPVKNMRGQSYDNGANMKGKNSGVHRRILNINPRVFYVPCTTHSLNLVLSDAAQSCLEAVELFGILQQIYNFFESSTHRWTVLKRHVPSLTVKPLSQTRWESRINAVIPFRYQIGEIYDALLELSIDERTDALSKTLALSLVKKVKSFKFVASVVIWHSILFRVNIISKMLQSETIDVSTAVEMIGKTRQGMIEMRFEKGFQQALVDARDLCDSLEIESEFSQESEIRPRKKRKQFDYESQDEAPLSPKRRFKQSFYFYILDVTISSLQERFEQLNAVNEKFGFLSNIKKVKQDEILNKCKDLHLALRDGYHIDIDGSQLYQEILVMLTLLPKEVTTPLEILTCLNLNRLADNFPNLSVALRIFPTLPVTVTTGERSFSKLKLIKTYLRSSMSQERLVSLATISIERDLLQNIDIENIMKDFADKKARKVIM
ncbi:Zinc finger MYM-type protein 1 [Araneus ventricosus]|uniref:Zinc finger MYM-type protein 1 n=1 Tax=Araneus ventricosus TaxID=182803 RepID=A0A4Y2HZY2_ARAVE|nr:Zinc finger MYM-type protein 1 [Araneus ventricosus]